MKKKKILLALTVLCITVAFASCDTKTCYCYYYYSDGTVSEQSEITNVDNSCNALSTGDGQVGTRTCVEYNERMNPGDLASKNKHNKK